MAGHSDPSSRPIRRAVRCTAGQTVRVALRCAAHRLARRAGGAQREAIPGESRPRRAALCGVAACLLAAAMAGPAWASFGVERTEMRAEEQNGAPATQAGSHPYAFTTTVLLKRHPLSAEQEQEGLGDAGPLGREIADGDARNVETTFPAGVIGDLAGVERCSEQLLARQECPASSQVGVVAFDSPLAAVWESGENSVFNIAPSSPTVAGALGFTVGGVGFIAHLVGGVHAGGDYGISARVPGIPQVANADGVRLTLWGDPSAPGHCHQAVSSGPCVAVPHRGAPFLTLPTWCPTDTTPPVLEALSASARAESWQEPGVWTPLLYSSPMAAPTGCERLSFTPSLEVRPETTVAAAPTGVSIVLKTPQVEAAGSLAEADMREMVLALPPGLVVSPSAVNGLSACSEAQVALTSTAPAACPESSKVGTVEARTPLLDHPVQGSVYIAQQGDAGLAQGSNPFGSLMAMYLVVEGGGIQLKIAGEVTLNETTGQVSARFENLPQLPYSELRVNFFGGPRAALAQTACGPYTTTTSLTPWSAPESSSTHPPATPQSTFTVSSGCPTGGFSPTTAAGTASNQAGGYSPLVQTFSRRDGEPELARVQERIPPGLLASITHVAECPEPQASTGECGSESEIGEITVVVGDGPDPLTVQGRVYFTGPYEGAPFGITTVTPARAGPFDLGNVIVRAALEIDPHTSLVTVTTDPLPTIFKGIRAQVKSVTVRVDKPEFTFNPTSCEHETFSMTIRGTSGAVATDPVPFQAAGCASLEFHPNLTVETPSHTTRPTGARLDVKLTYPPAPQGTQANIAKVKVELPKQLPARLTTLQKACPAARFDADPASCPAASDVGMVTATTPLLPVGLSGPVYFVSNGGAKFPEVVLVLQGDGVTVYLDGETYISKQGITSATFNAIPDVPVGSFELVFPQGPDSALASEGNLCSGAITMPTTFVAQNGAQLTQATRIKVSGCPKAAARVHRRHKRKRRPKRVRRAENNTRGRG
jgi:hypothetical protein